MPEVFVVEEYISPEEGSVVSKDTRDVLERVGLDVLRDTGGGSYIVRWEEVDSGAFK